MPELPEVERGRCLAQDVGAGRVIQQTHCQRDAIVFQGLRVISLPKLYVATDSSGTSMGQTAVV